MNLVYYDLFDQVYLFFKFFAFRLVFGKQKHHIFLPINHIEFYYLIMFC